MITVTVKMAVMSLEQVLACRGCFTVQIGAMNQRHCDPCMLMMECVIAVMGRMSLVAGARMSAWRLERRLLNVLKRNWQMAK